ncbi:tripartite motif-containing protein 60-like [Ctenodactylus gundi]
MELGRALEGLQAEASCPVCQGYLNNPVTLTCGHNFCLACINLSWKDLTKTFPCPSCYTPCPGRRLRNNLQLGNLTEIAKLLPTVRRSKRKRQVDKVVCEEHNQVVTMFCQKDLQVLCPQCSFSDRHRQHYISPIREAATYNRRQLDHCMELWRNRVEQVEKMIRMQAGKSAELKRKARRRREEIKAEFEQFSAYLQNERDTMLRQLEDEAAESSAALNVSLRRWANHASSLKCLLKETESSWAKPKVELLASVKSIYRTYRRLKVPTAFSLQLGDYGCRLPPQYSGLGKVKRFKVDVELDPETAHRKLSISEDRKSVRFESMRNIPDSPTRFYVWPAVLGTQSYSSGRQYWEVEVGGKCEWVLGVCSAALPRRRKFDNQPILVRGAFWGLGRFGLTTFVAMGLKKINLLPKVIPTKIGIFLDSGINEISFYNLDDKSLLHTFKSQMLH